MDLASLALQSFIDPDAPEFTPAGDIPTRIREFCKKTGQPVPETVGEVVRCINQSLAMKYRHAMEEIKECTGKDYKTVYMVGGGMQSKCRPNRGNCSWKYCTAAHGFRRYQIYRRSKRNYQTFSGHQDLRATGQRSMGRSIREI